MHDGSNLVLPFYVCLVINKFTYKITNREKGSLSFINSHPEALFQLMGGGKSLNDQTGI